MPKSQPKKNGSIGTKTKGAMAMAKAVAEKVKRSHEKGKLKKLRQQQQESDDELPQNNETQETIGLWSKTKIGKWIPSTNKRNSSVGESRMQRKPMKPSSPS